MNNHKTTMMQALADVIDTLGEPAGHGDGTIDTVELSYTLIDGDSGDKRDALVSARVVITHRGGGCIECHTPLGMLTTPWVSSRDAAGDIMRSLAAVLLGEGAARASVTLTLIDVAGALCGLAAGIALDELLHPCVRQVEPGMVVVHAPSPVKLLPMDLARMLIAAAGPDALDWLESAADEMPEPADGGF